MNMPSSQNRSNSAFRFGLHRLATTPTAKSEFNRNKTRGVDITGKEYQIAQMQIGVGPIDIKPGVF